MSNLVTTTEYKSCSPPHLLGKGGVGIDLMVLMFISVRIDSMYVSARSQRLPTLPFRGDLSGVSSTCLPACLPYSSLTWSGVEPVNECPDFLPSSTDPHHLFSAAVPVPPLLPPIPLPRFNLPKPPMLLLLFLCPGPVPADWPPAPGPETVAVPTPGVSSLDP